MNLKSILTSWNPWHLRKRVEEADSIISRLFNENQVLQFQRNSISKDIERAKDQRTANYTGLMTECVQLKKENERLKQESDWLKVNVRNLCAKVRGKALKFKCEMEMLYRFGLEIEELNDKGDTHEQK